MEELLIKQEDITTAIEKLVNNYKKDGVDRRTASAKKKLDQLQELFQDYHDNNLILMECADKKSAYFSGKHYETTKLFYESAVTYIKKYIINTDEEKGSSGHDELEKEKPENRLDEKRRKQAANYRAFQRTVANIDIDELTEKWEYEDKLKTLEARWTAIDSLHWEIESELTNNDLEAEFNQHEIDYANLKKKINTKMWSESHREKVTPKLEVPIFTGNYNQWVSFKDLFTEAIHNNPALSKAQKMQFLKGKVRGEAERLIQHLKISTDNYSVCWELLNHRYNNIKLIFSSHLNNLLDLPNMKYQSLTQVKKMYDVTRESINAINILGVDTSTWGPMIVHILDLKLDTETHSDYIDSLKDRRELPKLEDFLDFLEGKFTALESSRRRTDQSHTKTLNNQQHQGNQQVQSGRYFSQNHSNNNANYNKGNRHHIAKSTFNVTTIKCPLCNNEHGLYNCKKFLEQTNEQKIRMIKELQVCINCLFSHYDNECKSTKACRKCFKKHNTIMHDALSKTGSSTSGVTTTIQQNENYNLHVSKNEQSAEVLLSTAMIQVKGADGTYHRLRALVDQGSQISLITEKAAQLLKIKREKCRGTVLGVGEKENSGKGLLNIECQSIHNEYKFQTEVVVMNNLIGNLPNRTFEKPDWKFVENISLADPDFYISRPVDILLGAEIYSHIILGGIIKGKDTNQPIAQQTELGWLLCGSAKTYQCNVLLHNLEEIKKFWEIEEISEQTNLSVEEQECIAFYTATTNRKEDGRYEVRLPLQQDVENKLGASKPTALAQFKNLENKFQKQPKLANDYKSFINEYIALNHMKLAASGNETPEYYLPHHGVERSDSLTTQYRVVFNASNKTNTGCSLNDLMYTGPNLQIDLQMLLLKWRQYQYAFTADIEKMFRMILVNEEDQKYQKIIWRDAPEQPIQIFKLTTVTYGTRAAPFLAMMTLRRLAADERHIYPEASEVVESSFYMDDLLHGTDNIEEGKKLIGDLNTLMRSGGFNLRKWSSNDQRLLEDIKQERSESRGTVFNFKTENISKTLGLCWDSSEDKFVFDCKIPTKTTTLTKRSLLSEISRLFDPLGWLAPLSIKLKLLFQKLWKDELKWDDEVSETTKREWIRIKTELNTINKCEIPRWIMCHKNDVIQLHGFCDASIEAYACVVYAKIKGQTTTVIVAAKTKLVPHKRAITLPRLELSGAYLLSKLINKIKEAYSQHDLEVFGWTDSMVTLGWLQGEPNRWKPFVANRVQKTTEVIPGTCWSYVKTNENPADAASRGLYPTQLKENNLWWQGPAWLSTFEREQHQVDTYTTSLEQKVKQINVVQEQEENIIDKLLHKHSSFSKVTRVLAWLLRTFALTRKQLPSYLTLHELAAAKMLIVKHVQQMEFRAEIEALQKHSKLEGKSKLLNLNPFIDQSGVLRVGGRLSQANINMETKHPKIVPRDSKLAELLINEAHILTFHGGPRLTLASLRQQYWIPGGTNSVKKQLRNCVTCRKNNPTKQYQLMGDLPVARTDPAPPFYHTGVDYTGFIEFKANKMRSARMLKGYIALFICMVTKAIHLELVTDLTSSAFLAALRRMSARRGAPRHMYSDCGTNFIGANRLLQEEYEQLRETIDDSLRGQLAEMSIEWHFNAPSWPSAGGLWERAVRSLKHHLKRVVGNQRLTFEEYTTILAQMEACLNSRPLCALTEDHEDLDFLTPAHFLTGRAGVTVIETAEDARTRWYLTQQLFQEVWKRWRMEYLTQLNTRNKWLQPQRNMQIGDLVIIQDENLPAGRWPMARVIELHPGKDGYVRVVTLKTEKGITKRPIVKLCVLPLNITESEKQTNERKQEEERKNNNKKGPRSTLYSIAMALLFFMTLVNSSHGINNITQLNDNQTLYFDHVAINLQKDSYLPVSQENLQKCVIRDSSTYMCNLQNPIYKMKSDNDLCILEKNGKCKTGIAACNDEWTELAKANTYLYFCCAWCQVRAICGEIVTTHQLKRSNIISLDDDCVIKTSEFTIYGHKQYKSQLNVMYDIHTAVVAPINHIINLTIDDGDENNELNQTEMEHLQLMQEIEEKLKHLKVNETYVEEEQFSDHDIHHYTMIYCILVGNILLIAIVVWRRSCRSWRAPETLSSTEESSRPASGRGDTSSSRTRDTVRLEINDRAIEMSDLSKNKVKSPVFRNLVFSDDSN